MKNILIKIIFLLLPFGIMAQTYSENLQKYWFYRQRFNKFFVVNDNVEANDHFGYNIPYQGIEWKATLEDPVPKVYAAPGDGNSVIQYYIAMLATEYALLRRAGSSTSVQAENTKNELLYTLKAVERLDRYAESYYRKNGGKNLTEPSSCVGNVMPVSDNNALSDFNGFFVRDDRGKSFSEKWFQQVDPNGVINQSNDHFGSLFLDNTRYSGLNDGEHAVYEQSQDNVWNYLIGLALVVKLVDDPKIQLMARNITYKMINKMHHSLTWKIINPVTGEPVYDGASVNEVFCLFSMDYGFASAGNAITGYADRGISSGFFDLHYAESDSECHEGTFYTSLTQSGLQGLYNAIGSIFGTNKYNVYPFRIFAAISNKTGNDQVNAYDLLRQERLDVNNSYEHLPLINFILHGEYDETFNSNRSSEMAYYENLLNVAPKCGIHNTVEWGSNSLYSKMLRTTDVWACPNRLTNPEQAKASFLNSYATNNSTRNHNGLDYMLLFNLYSLVYYNYFGDYTLEPTDYDWLIENCSNLSIDPFGVSIKSECEIKEEIRQSWLSRNINGINIYSSRTIKSEQNTIYMAGERIVLTSGFIAENNSRFKGKISPYFKPVDWMWDSENECPNVLDGVKVNGVDINIEVDRLTTTLKSGSDEYEEIYSFPSESVFKEEGNVEEVSDNQIVISPNPAHNSITVNSFSKGELLQITSSTGQIVLEQTIDFSGQEIDISNLSTGVYFVTLLSNNESVYNTKLIKK